MTIKEMQEKREKLVADARSALEEIKANTDEARAGELDQRHDTIMAEFDALDAQIAREERVARAERIAQEARVRLRPLPQDAETGAQDEAAAPQYRAVFHKFLAAGADPGELTHDERAVLKAGAQTVESRMQTTTGGSGTAGGYTVPVELAGEIIKAMKAWGPMYDEDICSVLNTARATRSTSPRSMIRPSRRLSTPRARRFPMTAAAM